MRKWMVEFLRKFENRAIKIDRDNSILITQIYQFTVIHFNFLRCWGVRCDVGIFKLTASGQSIYREVYVRYNRTYTGNRKSKRLNFIFSLSDLTNNNLILVLKMPAHLGL